MKPRSNMILVAVFLGLSTFASIGFAGPGDASCSINIPAGTIIRVYPDEPIVAGTTSGPLLFTVASDVRFFLNRPPLIPRGSKVLARIETSRQAGRLWGRANARIVFTSILTPDFCEYAIDAALTTAGKYDVNEQVIVGQGHATRDVFGWLFPPTTLYQLIRLPARGPRLTIDEEQRLAIKVLESVYVATSNTVQSGASTGPDQTQPTGPAFAAEDTFRSDPQCTKMSSSRMIFAGSSGNLRSFQNTTPHDIVVYGNGVQVGRIAPCSESILMVPRGELKLKAIATIREQDGQREAEAPISLNEKTTGWQVLPIPERSSRLQ